MGLIYNNKKKRPTLTLMVKDLSIKYTFPFQCTFSPIGFIWPIFNTSFYHSEEMS
jgi:hypothetical protein